MNKLKLITNILKWGYVCLFLPEKSSVLPAHIQVGPTNYCNLKCSFCTRSSHPENIAGINDKNLTLDEFKNIIYQIKPQNIEISGTGEPLLNKDIFEILNFSVKNGIVTSAFSNFTLMTEENARKVINCGTNVFGVSIDASNRETYKKIRGEDKFEKVIRGIEILIRQKEELRAKIPFIRAGFVIQEINFREITEFVRLCYALGINGIFFQLLYFDSLKAAKQNCWELENKNELKRILLEAHKECKKINVESNLDIIAKKLLPVRLRLQDPGEDNLKRYKPKTCIIPWIAPFISVNGIVAPCCVIGTGTNTGEYGNMGDINNETFEHIWNNKKFFEFRKAVKSKSVKDLPDICQGCVPRSFRYIIGRPDFLRILLERF